jgi:hypothetical protein
MEETIDVMKIILTIFKVGFIITAGLYVIFAFVITKQIKVMKETLITKVSPIIQLLGLIHLVIAIILLTFYIFFL